MPGSKRSVWFYKSRINRYWHKLFYEYQLDELRQCHASYQYQASRIQIPFLETVWIPAVKITNTELWLFRATLQQRTPEVAGILWLHFFPRDKIGHFYPAVFRIQTPHKIQTNPRQFFVLTRFSIHHSFLTARFFSFFRNKILHNQSFFSCNLFKINRFCRIQQTLDRELFWCRPECQLRNLMKLTILPVMAISTGNWTAFCPINVVRLIQGQASGQRNVLPRWVWWSRRQVLSSSFSLFKHQFLMVKINDR